MSDEPFRKQVSIQMLKRKLGPSGLPVDEDEADAEAANKFAEIAKEWRAAHGANSVNYSDIGNLARAHLALIAERDRWNAIYIESEEILKRRIASAEAERDALLKYARHLPSCELAETDFCTCGYKEALAAAPAQPAEEKQP